MREHDFVQNRRIGHNVDVFFHRFYENYKETRHNFTEFGVFVYGHSGDDEKMNESISLPLNHFKKDPM